MSNNKPFFAPPPPPPTQQATTAAPPPPFPVVVSSKKNWREKLEQEKIDEALKNPIANPKYIFTDTTTDLSQHKHDNVKILILQVHKTTSLLATVNASTIEKQIEQEVQRTQRKPDFIICPENWLPMFLNGEVDANIVAHPALKPILQVVKKYQVYAILGTMYEKPTPAKPFITCLVIKPDGTLFGSYRKRKSMGNSDGDRPAIFDCPFGRFAVQICFDIENRDVMETDLPYKPWIIFNPVFIPKQVSAAGKKVAQVGQAKAAKDMHTVNMEWKTAIELMTKNYEKSTMDNNLNIIRCDYPCQLSLEAGGSGTSQLISPHGNVYAPHFEECSFSVLVPKPGHMGTNLLNAITKPSTYIRTDDRDNIGNRYTLRKIMPVHNSPVLHMSAADDKHFVTASKTEIAMFHILSRTCMLKASDVALAVTRVSNQAWYATESHIKSMDPIKYTIEEVLPITCPITAMVANTTDLFAATNTGSIIAINLDSKEQKEVLNVGSAVTQMQIANFNLQVHVGTKLVEFDLQTMQTTSTETVPATALPFSLLKQTLPCEHVLPLSATHVMAMTDNQGVVLFDTTQQKVTHTFIHPQSTAGAVPFSIAMQLGYFFLLANKEGHVYSIELTSNRVMPDFATLFNP